MIIFFEQDSQITIVLDLNFTPILYSGVIKVRKIAFENLFLQKLRFFPDLYSSCKYNQFAFVRL